MSRPISLFQGAEHKIGIKEDTKYHEVFRVRFGSDGSLYVIFPFFERNNGLVSLVRLPSGIKHLTSFSLLNSSRTTQNLVKFSYHPSGNIRVSQTGRVQPLVKQGVELDKVEGHLFTVKAQGLQAFKTLSEAYVGKNKFRYIPFTKPIQGGYKFTGFWYKNSNLVDPQNSSDIGPFTIAQNHEGKRQKAMLLAPSTTNPMSKYILVIAVEQVPPIDSTEDSALHFIGGFDSKEAIHDLSTETTFLGIFYPSSEDHTELTRMLGTMDLPY